MHIREFALDAVRITEPVLVNAFEKEQEYLRSIEPDRLLAGFRETAGLEKKADRYPGGWENSELSGHTFGHYMVALSQVYASTEASDVKERLEYIVDELAACQAADGYLFATGKEIFDKLESNGLVWMPWYTMHKLLSGLLSVYRLVEIPQALLIAKKLGEWICRRVLRWTDKELRNVRRIADGGMNDCLYELYKETGNETLIEAAGRFDDAELYRTIADGNDVLKNKHANNTIPKFLGAINRYMTLGESEQLYLDAAKAFFDMVVNDHTYVIGGNGELEHFRAPGQLAADRNQYNCETCSSYNMLKLAERLYAVTGEKAYMDFYERTFFNAMLGSQNPETGMVTFFQPMETGFFRAFGTPFSRFWCCTGTGMESFTKLNKAIYHSEEEKLYVNMYIASELRANRFGLRLTQKTEIDSPEAVSFAMELDVPKRFTVCLRIPEWSGENLKVMVNGAVPAYKKENGYILLEKTWESGDRIALALDPQVVLHPLKDAPNCVAATYGPFVLAAGLGREEMTTELMGVNVIVPTKKITVRERIVLNDDFNMEEWFENCNTNFIKSEDAPVFSLQGTDADKELVFAPYYKKYNERYGVYFDYYDKDNLPDDLRALQEEQRRLEEERRAAEEERLRLEAEAEAERLRLEAEAEAERLRLEAEAEAERLRKEAEEEERRRKEEEERAVAAEAARLAEVERLRREEEERLRREEEERLAAEEAARLAEEERLRREEEERLAAEAARLAEEERLAAEEAARLAEEERLRREEEERLAAEAARLAEEERLRKEEEERLAAEAARLAEEERLRKEEEERLAAEEAARLAEEERLRKEEEERLAAEEAARLAEEERLRKEEEERLAAEEAARKAEEERLAAEAAEAKRIEDEAKRAAAQKVAEAERAAEIAEAKVREEEANLKSAKLAAEKAEAEAAKMKAEAETEAAKAEAEASKAARAEDVARQAKANKEATKAKKAAKKSKKRRRHRDFSVGKLFAWIGGVLALLVLLYLFATPISKGVFIAKDAIDTFFAEKIPKVAEVLKVKGNGAAMPVFKDTSGTVYCVEDAENYVAETSWPQGYQASVVRRDGKQYIRIEGNGLKAYYLNEIAEKESKQVYLEQGDRKAMYFWEYDFAKPETLCPVSGTFNGDGTAQYAFDTKGDGTELHVLDASTLSECKMILRGNKVLRLLQAEEYLEEEESVRVRMIAEDIPYTFDVPKKFGADIPEDYHVALDGVICTLKDGGIDFEAQVVSAGYYLGKLVGEMEYSDQVYSVEEFEFFAYASETYESEDGAPVLPAIEFEQTQKEQIEVMGDGGESLLVPINDERKKYEYDKASFLTGKNGEISYVRDGKTISVKGVDVSRSQGSIDWETVAASGVEYAMIRLGIRGDGTNGKCQIDSNYSRNVRAALKEGIEVGVYFTSRATTLEEAKEEAQFVIKNMKDYDITWPVALDTVEYVGDDKTRASGISAEVRTACAKAFLGEIAAAGYTPVVYADTRWSVLKLDMSQLAEYDLWYASEDATADYPYHYTMWQYNGGTEVPGINGAADISISFIDYGEAKNQEQ